MGISSALKSSLLLLLFKVLILRLRNRGSLSSRGITTKAGRGTILSLLELLYYRLYIWSLFKVLDIEILLFYSEIEDNYYDIY